MAAAFLVPAVLAVNYTLNYYYGFGASVWDAGYFAWLSTNSASLMLPSPPCMGGSYLVHHVAPIFSLFAALYSVLPFHLPPPAYFALTQGAWHGILGAAMAWCALACLPGRPWAALALALACAGNGIVLAMLGFPHYEIAIPALLASALVLRLAPPARGGAWVWILPLLLLLTIREDAGFHAAGIFGCLALWRLMFFPSPSPLWGGPGWGAAGIYPQTQAAITELTVALIGAACSVADLLLQKHLFPNATSSLTNLYLGTPAFAHLTPGMIADRALRLLAFRNYVWAPLLLTAVVAALRRDARLLIGGVACLPWYMLNVVAISPQIGLMVSYYSFPMMIALLWPLLAALPSLGAPATARLRYIYLQAGMAGLSIMLFVGLGTANHDPAPWRGFGIGWAWRIGPMEAGMDRLLATKPRLGRMIADDAVASLRMGAFGPDEVRFAMGFTAAEEAATDTLVYQPGTFRDTDKQVLIGRAGLRFETRLEGTPFRVRTRLPPGTPRGGLR
jgi:hypothetical protein